jgi:hypothetical protein
MALKIVEMDQRGVALQWYWVRLIAFLAMLLIGFPILLEPFGRDQGIHATIAFALDEGLVTYRDVFNMKPPLTTGVHWVSQALFGRSMMAIRLFDLLSAALVAVGLVEIIRRAGQGRIFALSAAFGFAVIYASYGYWEHAQTDGWAGFLVVGAIILMQSGWSHPASRERRIRMTQAGVILGLAFALKYTIGGAGILIFSPLLVRERFYWSDFFCCVAGGALVVTSLASVMILAGALGPFLEIQHYIMSYVGYAAAGVSIWDEIVLPGMGSRAVQRSVGIGAVVLCVLVWQRRHRLLVATIALWVLAAWISGHVQGKGFPYHYLPMVPVYGVVIGAAVFGVTRIFPWNIVRLPVMVVFLAALLVKSPAWQANINAANTLQSDDPWVAALPLFKGGADYDVNDVVAFAEQLSELRDAGDGLFLWGYDTPLYFLVKEPPRYRYPYSWPFALSYYDDRYSEDLMARLHAVPPRHFVVQKQDATPWVTGRTENSDGILGEVEGLEAFLTGGYRLILSVPRYDLFERVDTSG